MATPLARVAAHWLTDSLHQVAAGQSVSAEQTVAAAMPGSMATRKKTITDMPAEKCFIRFPRLVNLMARS
jgi:hypothetical protein